MLRDFFAKEVQYDLIFLIPFLYARKHHDPEEKYVLYVYNDCPKGFKYCIKISKK